MENLPWYLSLQEGRNDLDIINSNYHFAFPDGGYIGLDFGPECRKRIVRVRFLPKLISPELMVGGKFQGSNLGEKEGYEDIYTITTLPHVGWNEISLYTTNEYRYIRYLGPPGSYSQVSKLEFYTTQIIKNQNEDIAIETKLSGIAFCALPMMDDSGCDTIFAEGPDVYLTFRDFSIQTGLPFYIHIDYGPATFYHQHDFLELVYIKSGSCFHFDHNRIIHLCPGDFLIVPTHTEHGYFGGSKLLLTNILLYPDRLPEHQRRHLEELPGIASLFHPDPCMNTGNISHDKIHLYIDDQKKILPLLEELEKNFLIRPAHYKVSCYALLLQLAVRLSECLENSIMEKSEELDSMRRYKSVARAIRYLQENYANIDNITDVHQHLQISYSWLAHIFKEETGLSLNDYLIRIRIAESCYQLMETDDEVTSIAYRVGFASYSNFGRTFKQLIGSSPLEFRNSMQRKHPSECSIMLDRGITPRKNK